jgi:hypothetical protein
MHTNAPFAIAPLLLPALLLSGCIDVRQEVSINPDGTGRLRFDLGVRQELSAPGEEEPTAATEMGQDFKDIARVIHRDPRVRSLAVREFSQNGWDRAEIDLVAHDWRDLPELNRLIVHESGESGLQVSGLEEYLFFSLREDDDGVTFFRQPEVSEPTPPPLSDSSNGPIELFGRALTRAVFDEGMLTVTLRSPMVSRTNGLWQLDKASVRWSVPLADLIDPGRRPDPFTAEIGPSARSSHFWRVVGIIMAVTALVGLLAWFRSTRRAAREAGTDI